MSEMTPDHLRQRHTARSRTAPPALCIAPSAQAPGTAGGAPPKSLLAAYTLWALPLLVPPAGLLGLHHLCLGRDVHAALHMLSFGGLGLGWLRDGVRLGAHLRQAAPSSEERELERRRRELCPRPGVAWAGS